MTIRKIVFIVAAVLAVSVAPMGAVETWKIASLNWEPYSGVALPNDGSAIQALRALLRQEGVRLCVEFYPWARAQARARSHEYIGYFPAWPEEVKAGFVPSPPVDWSAVGVLTHGSRRLSFESIDDLFRKYSVGIVQTYAYPSPIREAMERYPEHVDASPNEMSLLRKLVKGRHRVAVTDPRVMMFLAEQEGIADIELVRVLMKKELVIAFRDDAENRARLERLQRLLDAR